MSFGTGHHETTHMMIQHLLETEVTGMKTLDMGCGTAILAILAEMKALSQSTLSTLITGVEFDRNAERNNCKQITVYEGDASMLKDKKYDLIIANINRNILLNDMQSYVDCLNQRNPTFKWFLSTRHPFIDASCTEKGLC
jgi:ribosomal protein L11 methyltransferase